MKKILEPPINLSFCHEYGPSSTSEEEINTAETVEYEACGESFSNLSKSSGLLLHYNSKLDYMHMDIVIDLAKVVSYQKN